MKNKDVTTVMKMICIAAIVTPLFIFGCEGSGNVGTKLLGGTMNIKLEPGEKLLEATWRDNNLWYLTREMREKEFPETYTFKEKSTFGALEGTVVFTEQEASYY